MKVKLAPVRKLSFLVLCFCAQIAHAQFVKNGLLGVWQIDHAEITSMYHDTYSFFDNDRFAFKPNEYNGLNRIISILGRYSVKGDTLFLIADSTEELIGGYPVRSEMTTLSDSWEIVDAKTKMIACKKKERQSVLLKPSPNEQAIFLDQRKYYRVGK